MSYRTGVLLLLLPAVAWATHIELSPRSSTDRPPNEEPGGSTITLMLPGLEACFDPADPVLARGVVGKITIRLKNDGTAKVYGSGDPLLARGPIADCIREQDSAVSIPKLQEPSTTFYVDVRILPALARPADQAVDLTVPPHFDGAPLHGEPIDVRGKRAWTPLLAVATLGSEAWDDKNTVKVQVSVRRTKNGVYKDTSDLEDALVDVVDLDGALLTTATTDVAGEVLVPVACSAGPMVWVGGRHPDSGAWLTPPQLVDLDAQPCPDLRHRNMLEEALQQGDYATATLGLPELPSGEQTAFARRICQMLSEDATVPPNTAFAVWLRLDEYGECVVPTRTLAAGWSQLGGDPDAWREGPWHALTLARDPTVLQPAVCQAAQLGATQTGEDQAIELLLAASGTAPNGDARDCIDALVRERMVDSLEPACSAWADGQAEASELPPSWALRGPWRQVKRASFGYFMDDGRPIDPHPGLMDEIVGKIPEPQREAAQLVVCADSSRHLADRETWAISEPEPPYTQGYPWGDPFRAVTQLRVIEAYGESCPARCAAATLSRHTGDMRHWNKSLNAYHDDVWRTESTLASVRIAKRRMKRNLPTYEGLMPGAEAELLDGTVGWWLVREHQRDCLAGREGEERCASTARQAHGYDNWEGNLPGWSREVDGHIERFCRTTLPAMKAPPSAEEFMKVNDNFVWWDDEPSPIFYSHPPDTHVGNTYQIFDVTEKQLRDAYQRSWPQAWKGASEELCSDLGSLGFLRLTCSVEEGEDRPENCLYTVPQCVEMMQDWCPD